MNKKTDSNIIIGSLLAMLFNFQTYAHNHSHRELTEKQQQAALGIFENSDVKNRQLSDWNGTWQSVYEYLLAGDLDPVFKAKSIKNPLKTIEDYRAYYKDGYATDIIMIGIENNRIDFHKKESYTSCQYQYDGYKILTYASGNKGVRYLFSCLDKDSQAPKYVQFSDHIIEPSSSEHSHIFMGNQSHEKLLEEMDNWPTYYPLSLKKEDIVDEMLYH